MLKIKHLKMKKIGLTILNIITLLLVYGFAQSDNNGIISTDNLNRIVNPGFEKNYTDNWEQKNLWGGAGRAQLSTRIKRTGKNAIKLSKTNSFGYVQLSLKKTVRVLPGEIFTFRFWFNATNAQITSFLIPRIVTNNASPEIANAHSSLWVDFDYDSQSLMRNSPTTKPDDWIKRIIFYENKTTKSQDVYLQVMLYGNPFDVYVDDFEFVKGKLKGTKVPADPAYNYTEEQALKILATRKEETAMVSGLNGTTNFTVNGKPEWPIFYRALVRPGSVSDAEGFAAQGININNAVIYVLNGKDGKYDWPKYRAVIIDILRRNPNAKLLLELGMDPDSIWLAAHPTEMWLKKNKQPLAATEVCSYASPQWRQDGSENIKKLITDMKANGFWKIVVGANIVGGHDWQFWTKVIGEYAADYSEVNLKAWHDYLSRKYISLSILNQTWIANYASFNEIPIPDPATDGENLPAIMPNGAVPDFRQFCEASAFELRETFAKVVKQEAGKNVFVGAYSMPMENQHLCFLNMAGKKGKANDMIASMSFYPYRQPGFASGYHPEQSFGYHNTSFMQELDLRYHISDIGWYDEQILMWCSSQNNIIDWRNMHRKLVGISLAQNQGYWYYDMDKQFVDKEILKEVGKVKKITDHLLTKKGVDFKPDVCLVKFGAESRNYGSSVDNAVGATVQWQYMQLETSGVPYDIHYLSDIMAESSLQKYRIFIFHNNSYLSEKEKEWINTNLKNNNRTIIWLYDNGYISDKGLSINVLSSLTGMTVKTTQEYKRSVAVISATDKISWGVKGYLKVPKVQGMAEALCGIFSATGNAQLNPPTMHKWGYMASPGVSRYQKFWIAGGYDAALAKYRDDDKIAMAVKHFPSWTSIYIAAPNALAGEMMNNIAKSVGVYIAGAAGMGELRMSGRFVSYHALKSGNYIFNLPKGASNITDAETGSVLAQGVKNYTINGRAQTTYWYFID